MTAPLTIFVSVPDGCFPKNKERRPPDNAYSHDDVLTLVRGLRKIDARSLRGKPRNCLVKPLQILPNCIWPELLSPAKYALRVN